MSTEARRLARDLFDAYNPYEGSGFENHCLRVAAFAELALERAGLHMNPDRVHLLAMVHDLGLLSDRDAGANYLERSWALFEREMNARGCPEFADELARECLVFNHRVGKVPNLRPEAEAFRKAVWIEHTFGTRRYGLPASRVREIRRTLPRDNFNAVMADFWRRVLLHEPRTVVDGIFF